MLLVEQVDRRVAAETQAAFLLMSSGQQVELPDREALLRRLDAVLSRPPSGPSVSGRSREQVLREAFGLTAGG